jgi:CheY-like chemotaxis protein
MAKQAKHGGRAPVVVMFAAIAGSMDRMKAGLAGCDAYLPRSISEAELYKTLAQHRLVNLNAFAKTNIGR